MQFDGGDLGGKTATRSGILNSGKKSFWIKLPGSESSEFWFELGFKGQSSAYLRQKISDSSFRPRYVDVSVTVTKVEEQVVEIEYPNWIDIGTATDQQYRFQVDSAEVALIAVQAGNIKEYGQIVAEFGNQKNRGCRIQTCTDKKATECRTVMEPADKSVCNSLGNKRTIWAQLVNGEFRMGLVGDNKPIASYSGASWLGDAGVSKKLAIGTRGDGKWQMAG
ncbi:uncharacterized protein LOC119722862 [Patiria miniata]|uniref:Uncharacterized protein n=1 Tax=Patiria miniata TaxID=46514 RepID=A0A913ZBL9_PATMI|nr:uncharacterized protein LOC119722862 [Patiria miniata]